MPSQSANVATAHSRGTPRFLVNHKNIEKDSIVVVVAIWCVIHVRSIDEAYLNLGLLYHAEYATLVSMVVFLLIVHILFPSL